VSLTPEDRIENHLAAARSHTAKANEYRELASARRVELHAEVLRDNERAAKNGNDLSKRLLRNLAQLGTVTDARCSGDAIWKGHVANNQWYIKQSLMESNMATMEILYANRQRSN
jgi:hypothetical protein